MSNDTEEISKNNMETEEAQITPKSEIGIDIKGELPCVLVYSERKHVDYIYALLSQIESVLRNNGFNPQRLGDEIRSTEDYLEKLEELIENAVLGIVILDAFRPNVLFEFGFLKGKKKPIILLQTKDAVVNVKTLYKSRHDSELSERQFNLLKNPRIDCPSHFSDFDGKHIAYIDWRVRDTDPSHPSVVLRNELEKNKNQIIEETRNVKTKNISPSDLQEFMQPISNIIKYYYTDAEKFEVIELREAQRQITSIVQKRKLHVPNDIYSMIAATYVSKAKQIEWTNVTEIIDCFNSATSIYQEILKTTSIENNPIIHCDTQKKIGDIYQEISRYIDRNENNKKAINAYKEALKVFTIKRFTMQYATTQNNLGNAYGMLAEGESRAENSKKAIKAYEEALKVHTFERFPMRYATTQNNLGNAYNTLAKVEEKAGNSKRAIHAFEEAFKVYTLGRFSMQYATTQNNLGNAYNTLAKVEAKANNSKKSIKACHEALKIRIFKRFPMDYATTQTNLGNAYRMLAEVEAKTENCKNAIMAYAKAQKVFTEKEFPEMYLLVKRNLKRALTFCEGNKL